MSLFRCVGGGGTLYDLVKSATVMNAGTGVTNQNFTAEIGKRYLVFALRYSGSGAGASDTGIQSGATVDTVFINNVATTGRNIKIWVAIVKATATTVTIMGTSNGACYMPLD